MSVHRLNVSLVFNPATGYISPQFHCTYDDYFETPKLEGPIDVHWKRLAKLQENEETKLYDKEFDMIQGKPLKDYEPPPPILTNPREKSPHPKRDLVWDTRITTTMTTTLT